jgi:predicted O-methyltransferase YrrM
VVDTIEQQLYKYCLTHNKPYFGNFMHARQGSIIRHAYMQLLVEQECRNRSERPFNIVEVGSWAGGSAITWAEAVKRFSKRKGLIICIDKWEPYFEPCQCEETGPYKEMENALLSGKIFELFMHNIKVTSHDDVIIPFKGWSDELLPLLGDNKFDLVFIDGNHAYTNVCKDIENSMPLVSEGGVICGDDLEQQLHQLDIEYAKEHRQKDYIIDPKAQKHYHPGVSLAIGEFFGEVSVWEGFWAMRKVEGHWKKVELSNTSPERIVIPVHLAEERANNYLQFGQELYKDGRITEAEQAFLRAHALIPNSTEVHKALAVVYWKLKNLQNAIGHMQQVFQLESYNQNLKSNYNRKMEVVAGKGH